MIGGVSGETRITLSGSPNGHPDISLALTYFSAVE
jgi:hypothetical protein